MRINQLYTFNNGEKIVKINQLYTFKLISGLNTNNKNCEYLLKN